MVAKVPILEMKDIHKSFGEVKAVDGVSLKVNDKETVAIVGDNGAGKSTLIKILMGLHKPDRGEIYFEGKKRRIRSPRNAQMLGIETLYQDQALVDCLEVPRNIFMGREMTKYLGFLDLKGMVNSSRNMFEDMGLSISSVKRKVEDLSGGERQGVAMGRALHFEAKLVCLDEPTISLSTKGVKRVLQYIKKLKFRGIAVILVTHNLNHAFSVADKFIIMKAGKVAHEAKKEETSMDELDALIVPS